MSDPSYRIDVDSIRRAFPPGTEAPPLLLDFAVWLKGRPWGSVGCFDLRGQFVDSAPIVDGSPLRDKFGLFIRLPEGSEVGTWYGTDVDQANPPVVVLGSEGEHEIIAPSLDSLLARIALQQFEDRWSDFLPDEDVDETTDELADWLAPRLGAEDLATLAGSSPDLPDFRRWMETWCRDREEYWANHTMMAELGWRLAAHLPKGKNLWDKTRFKVAIVGAQYQARVMRSGPQSFKEEKAIEPLLRELRDDMRRAQPELGLWYSMDFGLYADGRVMPRFDYDERPTIDDVPAELSEAKADLARAPRPERWVPTWLAAD
ncbi:hypothetical protein Q3C01_10815 [Bradyrhizobium sp. UFLA05-109]